MRRKNGEKYQCNNNNNNISNNKNKSAKLKGSGSNSRWVQAQRMAHGRQRELRSFLGMQSSPDRTHINV